MAEKLLNVPQIALGVVGVSRDCFPVSLTRRRLDALSKALGKIGLKAHICSVIIENENDVLKAEEELKLNGCNACVVYLGNFGPEGPTSMFIQRFRGPVMICGASEENKEVLKSERGDALCGLLSLSYNLDLRGLKVYIPKNPIGLSFELAEEIELFLSIARVLIGIKNLKIFSFGPRPQDFYTCSAPIKPLFELGVELMENSELDLFHLFKGSSSQKKRISTIEKEMKAELGRNFSYPDLLPKLAQYELTLLDFMEKNLGASKFGIFANKCWPSFEYEFRFVPCYVNSRLARRGIPVACEADIYGALSEYMVQLASLGPATLLDINNTVPEDIIPKSIKLSRKDLFMGFHCGNTPSCYMRNFYMNYQVIMNRLMEDSKSPDITRGTLEGEIKPSDITLFRLQASPDCHLKSYIAEGRVLDIKPHSFGSIGVIHIPGFAKFYRDVLLEKRFPHHCAVGFKKSGRVLFESLKLLAIPEIYGFNED